MYLSGFSAEMEKIAFRANSSRVKAMLHLTTPEGEKKNWKSFERGLKTKLFQNTVLNSDLADEKLKKYTENFGGYLRAKKEVGKVSGDSKVYSIRELPNGRLGCGCKDWQYKKSVSGGDCKHIAQLRAMGTTG